MQSKPATLTIVVLIFLVILPMPGYFRSDTPMPMALLMACSALLLFGLVQYRTTPGSERNSAISSQPANSASV